MHLNITSEGRQVYAQNIPVTSNSFHKVIIAKLNAGKKGLQRFVVMVTPVGNELSVKNNSETLYVNVLERKGKSINYIRRTPPRTSAPSGILLKAIKIMKLEPACPLILGL